MKNYLLDNKWWDEAQETVLFEQLRTDILAAVKVAEVIDKPNIDSMITDVYDAAPASLNSQLETLKAHISKYPESYPLTAGKF
jgi:2-oxoisovalerate dehydrogenase E1 component alpha subunit